MSPEDQLRDAYARAVEARVMPARSRCVTPDALLALVRREGPEPGRLVTLDHAMACTACRNEFELLRSIERAGGEGIQQAVDGLRWKRHLSMAIAASAILAISIGPARRLIDGSPDVTRGAPDAITLLAPEEGESASGADRRSLTFVWRPVPGAEQYVVELLTADGVTALSEQTTDTVFRTAPDRQLDAGEYRWWVRAQAGDGTERRSAARRLTLRP